MLLTKKEQELILRRRRDELKSKGAIVCWVCEGTGSGSQSDCQRCDGRGWFSKDAPEVKQRRKALLKNKAAAVAQYDAALKALR